MGITKKLLSTFLSSLIVLSSVSAGLTVFAEAKAYNKLDENHQALATDLQKEYVVDSNNYIKAANREYVANDNENGDIAEASEAFFKIIDASEKKRYGTAVKAVETTLKSAMGSDYTAEMSKTIGFICGNGSVSAYTSNYTYKFTVNQNINNILKEYENSVDIPDNAEDKATVYSYTQTGSSSSYKTAVKKELATASTSAFKNFEAMFNADILSSDYDKLPDGMLESIDANGQSVIDEASVISSENIKRLLGKEVSIEAAQAYLDGILLFKAKEYTNLIAQIKNDLGSKQIEDLDFEALNKLKARLDEADKLYNSYVDIQKESVKEAYNDYNELVLFYQDSYNYNKAPEYAQAVKAIEKYADESYQFTREELDGVKKALDNADKKYGEFLGTPTYPSILENKAIYDKALENYTKAYEYFDWQDYYKELNEFAKCFDVDAVLDIPNSAYLDGAKMVLIDDEKQSVYKAEEKFVYLIDFLFTKHKDDYQNIESAVSKITDDLTAVMGKESIKNKDVYNILLNYFNNGPVTSKSASKTILIRPPYLFDYATVAEIPEKITYQSNQFVISYNSKTGAYTSYRKSTPNSIDSNAYNVFSLFELTFTDAFLNKDLNACTFDELSLIRRKSIEALELVKEYPRIDIIHFFGEERYAKAQKLNETCDELMRQSYNEMVAAIIGKYGNRDVQRSELNAFFDEASVIDNAYNQLSDAVKALNDVIESTEKYNQLKLYVKGVKDEADADDFVKMADAFIKKYPKSSLSMEIYDEFTNELKQLFDFYSSCSEETQNKSSVQRSLKDITALNEKMDKIFKTHRLEEFKTFAKDNLDPLYTGDLDDAQIVEFSTFDIAKVKQIILDINRIYGDLSDKAKEDKLVVGYMTVVSKLNDRITLLTNPPRLTPYSVIYPNGVTEAQLNEIITVLDTVLASDLIENLAGKPLDKVIDDALNGLLTKDLINTLVGALYPLVADALGSNASVAGALDINVLPKTLAKNIKHYPAVKAALESAGDDWNAVDWELCDWVTTRGVAVTDLDTFIDALGESLSGLTKVLNVLLNGTTLNAIVITLYGNQGYEKDILPLLEALGCDESNGLVNTETFNNVQNDVPQMLRYIIYPLLDRVKEMLKENTVSELLELLPNLGYIIGNDLLNSGFADLVSPLKNQIDLVETLNNAGIDLTNLVDTLNVKLLKNAGITLPLINWNELAGIGSLEQTSSLRLSGTRNIVKANKEDVLVYFVRYAFEIISTNKESLTNLISSKIDNATINTIVSNLLNLSGDDFIIMLTDMFKGLDSSSFKADWSFLYNDYKATSVSMPNGVTSAELEEVVGILPVAVNNALSTFLDKPLTSLASDNIYTDYVITSLAKSLYSLGDNETVVAVFGLLGCNFSKDAIAKSLKSDYRSVAKSIDKASSLSTADSSSWEWNVSDRKSFAKALVAVLRPFEPVLNVLLNSGTVSVAGTVDFTGANGYENAIKPILDTLGCAMVNADEYSKDAKKNADNLLLNIINPLLDKVDELLQNPLKTALELLPQIANFVDKGGVQYSIECLLYPVANLLNPVVKTVMGKADVYALVSDLLGVEWGNLQNEIIPLLNSKVLNSITVNDKTISLLLPPLDWAALAGCGRIKGNSIQADTGKETITILRYVFSVLEKNESSVLSLIGGAESTVGKIVSNLISCGADGLVNIVVNILLKMTTFDNADWIYKTVAQQITQYTENLGKDEYSQALDEIDPLISSLISELAGSSLKGLATGAVYTNNIVNTLAKLIYTNLESLDIGVDLTTVLSIVDVDISTSGVANAIKDYPSASKQIAKCAKWSDVNFDNINWGFKDGDRNGFVNALAAVLRPLYSVLRVVLSGDDLVALGSLHIKGGNGYNTAIIPIAEALGIEPEKLVSPKQYAQDANSDKLITDILNPLLDKVEEILDSPVSSLSEMLPNLAYFVYNGGVKDSVENLITPVTRILKEIDPIYSVNIDLSMLDNIDIDSLVNSLIKDIKVGGKPLGIKISDIDLKKLAGRGEVTDYLSARTYNENRMQAKRITADKSAVFISVLRYLVENVKYNLDAINNLISGLDIPENIAGIINQILTALTTEEVDSVIEMLMDLLFGFGGGTPAIQPVDKTAKLDLFKLGNYYWVYWVVFAGMTVIIGASLFLILKKKKRKNDGLADEKKEGINV